MDRLIQDLRYAARRLVQTPSFTAVAVLTLAIGIGANAAIFSVVHGVLLRPLPYPESDRLVLVRESNPGLGFPEFSASFPNYVDFATGNRTFDAMAAWTGIRPALTGGPAPERLQAQAVSASFFAVLGVKPQAGRGFVPEEDRPGGAKVVVVSDGFSRQRFGSPSAALGRTLILDGEARAVVGVMPAGFGEEAAWVPLALDPDSTNRGGHYLGVVGRLKPGVTLAQAQADLEGIARRLQAEYPGSNAGWGVRLVPLHESIVGDVRPALLVLLGAVGVVLLIACLNVSNLLIARAVTREREIAIRTALGAARRRLVQQLLTESLLLALLGGALGVVFGIWGVDLLLALEPGDIPRLDEVRVDGRILGFTLALSLLTGLVFGLAPALQVSKPLLNESLKDAGARSTGGRRRRRVRDVLVVAEVALALVLLIGAGLLIRSFLRLQNVDPGLDPESVLTADLSLPEAKYGDEIRQVAFYDALLERLESVPGAVAAGTVLPLPLSGGDFILQFTVADRPLPAPQEAPNANVHIVSAGYFDAMRIGRVRGRTFDRSEGAESSRVVVVNETMARTFWPAGDPIGKRLTFDDEWDDDTEWFSVVGVVRDVRHKALGEEPGLEVYVPYRAMAVPFATIVLRGGRGTDARELAGALRREVQALDPDLPLEDVRAMEAVVSGSLTRQRFSMVLLGVFAGVALLLACLGIYGVMAYSVVQRTREIGIRAALGAGQRDVLRLVLRHGMALTLAGVAAGLLGALAAVRVLSTLLYGVSPTDLATFAGVATILGAIALLACVVPARRAMRVDPVQALRQE